MMPTFAAARGYYFNGAVYKANNNGGAINLEVGNPVVDVSNFSDVSAWVMTCDGSKYFDYAQVGWYKDYNYSTPKYFYEYSYGSDFWRKVTLGYATPGNFNDYRVGCDSSKMYFIIDNISYGTVNLTDIPFTRNCVQYFGETHEIADQCPGTVTNPISFSYSQYKTTSNVWLTINATNPNSLGYGDLTTMRNNILSSGSWTWEIWDSRYY